MSTSISCLETEIEKINDEISKIESELTKWQMKKKQLQEKRTTLKNKINKLKSESLASVDWSGSQYEWSEELNKTLENIFKIKSFRPKQLSAINSTLSNEHALVVMPTGAGKSLCYQLPALIKPGITVVISPLVSLMEDQIRSLTEKDIPAKLITSFSSKAETSVALKDLIDKKSMIKLLYVTPERFAKSKRFMSNLQKCYSEGRLQRIAIDEVHCCSQWGHDFRPDYKFLGILSNMFKGVPILGLTATATAHVLADVQKILNIPGCLVIKSTFNRPNLFYKILAKPSSQDECLNILEKLLKHRYKDETGIIYTNSIKDCEDIAEGLRKRGLKVGCYHATMESSTRSIVHLKWHNKHYQAIVATVAFGMGIDKPDVRFVIHHSISKSMENYYQESGRAGRDGLRAECVLLYRMQDIFRVSTMVFSSVNSLDHLYAMVRYCLTSQQCRRQLIAEHFDEDWGSDDCNKMCDVCSNYSNHSVHEIDISNDCRIIAGIIDGAKKLDIKLTAQKLLDAWYLKGPVNLRHKGKAPLLSRSIGEDVIAFLLVEAYLIEDFHFTAYSTISYLQKGPNMYLAEEKDFILKMSVRKYTSFSLEALPPDDYVPKDDKIEISKSECLVKSHKRKSSSNGKSNGKKSKIIVID